MRQPAVILVTLVAMLGGCAAARGTGASAQTGALEHVLDEWATAWPSSDVEKLLPLFTDDVRYEDVTFGVITQGKAGLRDFATGAFGAFPGMSFEIKSRFIGDNGKWGALEWVWRGRQVKDFPGLPATNRPFQVRGSTIVEFRDGKISRNSDYWDLTTYMKQVDLIK